MYKNLLSLALLILTIFLTYGCKDSLEKAYSLGDNIDPDNPTVSNRRTGVTSKPPLRCKKELVFGFYCLGSDIKTLLDNRKPLREHTEGDLHIFDFREVRGLTTITTFQGKILSAARTDRPANWQTLIAMKQRIEALYGKAENKSTFTKDINTSRRMEFAIYNKTAKAHYTWSMPSWRIDVVWDNIRDIRVTFLDEDLNEMYLTSRKKPLKSQ